MHVLHIFCIKVSLQTKLKKSDGSRNITCYLASSFFSCSKTQKWMHWHIWCTALPNFCLASESFNSPIFVAPVMPGLTLLLTGLCCTCCHFALPSPCLWMPKCPFSPCRFDVLNSPVPNFILLLHYFTLVTELCSSLSLNGHGLFLNSVS